MSALRRLGCMLVAPRATLRSIAAGGPGEALEPILLWLFVVLVIRAHDVYRLAVLAAQAPATILRRLRDLVGDEAQHDLIVLACTALGLALFGRFAAGRRTSFGAGVAAAAHLLVPLVALKVVGALLALLGPDLWWLPHRPVDDLRTIVVAGKVDWVKYGVKCAVAYGPPLLILLDLLLWLRRKAPTLGDVPAPPSAARARAGIATLFAGVALLCAVTAVDVAGKAEKLKPTTPGATLHATTLPWLHEKGRLDTQSLRGQVVVYDFWASWCAPCRRSIPELSRLHDELKGEGLVVLGVNREPYDRAAAQKAWDALAPSFQTVVDDRGWGERLGLTSLPTSYIVDRKGVVRAMHLGYTEVAVVRDEVKRLLAEAP